MGQGAKSVLITGGCGFIGSHPGVLPSLKEPWSDYEVNVGGTLNLLRAEAVGEMF